MSIADSVFLGLCFAGWSLGMYWLGYMMGRNDEGIRELQRQTEALEKSLNRDILDG